MTTPVRVLHIAAACTSLGGLTYARAVLWPALDRLPPAARADFLAVVMRRFIARNTTSLGSPLIQDDGLAIEVAHPFPRHDDAMPIKCRNLAVERVDASAPPAMDPPRRPATIRVGTLRTGSESSLKAS